MANKILYIVSASVLTVGLVYFALYSAYSTKEPQLVANPAESEVTGESTSPLSDAKKSNVAQWKIYNATQDNLSFEYPDNWEVAKTQHRSFAYARQYRATFGDTASFALYPQGEFDYGFPLTTPFNKEITINGKEAVLSIWESPDKPWLAVAVFKDTPKNNFRIELNLKNPDDEKTKQILFEMIDSIKFIE